MRLSSIEASDGLSSLVHVGSRLPATRTAMGRVLLAQKSEAAIRKLLTDQPEQAVAAAVQSWNKDRNAECVVHIGSFENGLCSVAAPVFDLSGSVVAAISATKASESVPPRIERSVVETAATISRGMGWSEQPL